MQLLNTRGAEVASWSDQQYQQGHLQVPVGHLSPGIYYLWLNSERGQEVKKIVIMR